MAVGFCAVAAGLAGHHWLTRRPGGPGNLSGPPPVNWPTPTTLQAPPGDPARWAEDPLAAVNMQVLPQDPADAVPPPGAIRQGAFRHLLPDGASDVVRYVCPRTVPALEDFYRTRLAQAGFKLVSRTDRTPNDGVWLVFLRQGQSYVVSLRPLAEGNEVGIVLVIARPGGRRPG
jgi:hypothetical protein